MWRKRTGHLPWSFIQVLEFTYCQELVIFLIICTWLATDKNQDCDTSCIFTIIQSAYEKLKDSAPDEVEVKFTRLRKEPKAASAPPAPYEFKSNQERQHQQSQPEKSQSQYKESTSAAAPPKKSFRYQATHASSFGTDQLRDLLRKFGVSLPKSIPCIDD